MTENNSANEKSVEAPEALPMEAGVSLNWTMIDTNGANVQVTMRAAFAASWPSVMRNRAGFMQKALENGWSVGGPKSPPATTPQAAPTVDDTAERQADAGRQTAPQPTGGNGLEVIATRIEISVRPDGKTDVKFFGDGDKYPRISGTKPAGTWATMLGWAESNFKAPATITTFPDKRPLRLVIGYTLSDKLNTKGNPYKDIQYIR